MESAMDSRNNNDAAAAPLPLYPPALLSLPDLDRPPAIMEMWELEAVAAALPAKKRRLRETFDRLAACSPTPLPFRWEDLDTYISSLQYSVTLRRRELRELEKSKPAPTLAPTPAAMSLLPVTGGGDVGQVRIVEKPRPAPAPAPVLPAISALPSTDGDAHKLRGLVKSKSVQPQPPAPPVHAAAVSAPAATDVHVEEGKKRKASIQEAEQVHVAKRTAQMQEGQAEMRLRKIQEDAAAKKKASPSHDRSGNDKELMPVSQGDDDNGLAAEANASTDATVQVDPVSKGDNVQPELPGPATATARNVTYRVRAAGVPNSTSPQQSRPPHPIPVSGAAASETAVTGRDPEKSKKRKAPSQDAEVARRHDSMAARNMPCDDGGDAKVSPRRPGHGSGNSLPTTAVTATAQVDAGPICETSNATGQAAVPPDYEVPDVEMLKEDASLAAKKACQTQVIIKSKEADKVSPLPLGCSNDHAHAQAGAGAATAIPQVAAAAASATVCKSSPTVTRERDCPNLVQASAPAPKTATRRAPPAPGSQQDASDVSSPVPPRGGNGPAQSSRVSAGAGTQAVSARDSAVVRRDDLMSATLTDPVPTRRREGTGPSEARAPTNARKHVLQQQHMPKHGPISSPKKQEEWSSKNHGGRPTRSSRSVPEAQDDATQPVPEAQEDTATQRSRSRPGEGRGGGLSAARELQGDDNNRNKGGSFKGKRPPLFCDKCGCKGHLAGNCRTARHLVALYRKAKEKEEPEQICYRCGCTGHWSRNCRTAKHLVDLYQKDRAAKRAAGLL